MKLINTHEIHQFSLSVFGKDVAAIVGIDEDGERWSLGQDGSWTSIPRGWVFRGWGFEPPAEAKT